MQQVSSQVVEIAVLRGGTIRSEESLRDGAEVLRSLSGLGYTPLDVTISRTGEWTLKGVPTDAHYIFTRAHYIVDTTRDRNAPHKELAKKMWVDLLLSHDDTVTMDRETMYRLLRQQGLPVPKTQVIRAAAEVQQEDVHAIWNTFHTPLMVRPLVRDHGHTSHLVRKFGDLQHIVSMFHDQGIDAHVCTYAPKNTLSVAVLPSFRGKRIYTPLPVEAFVEKTSLPRKEHQVRAVFSAGDDTNNAVRTIVEKTYQALGLSGHALVDVIPHKDGYMVVNVDTQPSLHKEGRFMQSLATTGADLGQYVHMHILHDSER